ncbi:MAG: PDZ domain-containing protein [Chitinophagaceae bacterium]|nr:PDZ domain-containing protein [Chitinophagaceae bacterium]
MMISLISFIVISGLAVAGNINIDSTSNQQKLLVPSQSPIQIESLYLNQLNENEAIADFIFNFNDCIPNVEKSIEETNNHYFLDVVKKSHSDISSISNQSKIELGILIEPVEQGLKIKDIMRGSPCDKAGLKIGDILTSLNNEPLTTSMILSESIRNAAWGSTSILLYIKKDRNTDASMSIKKVKLKGGGIQLIFSQNKIAKPISSIGKGDNKYSGVEITDINWNAGKKVNAYVPRSITDKLGNTTTYINSREGDNKLEDAIKLMNDKEIQELVKKIKVSDNQNLVALSQSGKLPNNISIDLKNTTTIKDALNQMVAAGINIDEKRVQNYLQNNGKQFNLSNNNLNQLIPASVLALYGNNEVENPRRVARKSRFSDPNAESYIKKLEALNRQDDGKKGGLPKDDGVASFSYSKPSTSKNAANPSDDNSIKTNVTKITSKDFIPASEIQPKTKEKPQVISSSNNVEASVKPVFIPSTTVERKVGETFKTNDFIPASEIIQTKKASVNSGLDSANVEKETHQSSGNIKTKDQSAFIASSSAFDKQSAETTRIINEMRAAVNANLRAKKRKEQEQLEKTNIRDVKSEAPKSKSNNEKTVVKEPTNDKASNSRSKQKETSKIDNKFVTTDSKSEKTKISIDKNVEDKALDNKNLSINTDKNQSTSINVDNSLHEKDSTNNTTISITEVNPVTKPVFIPEEKKPLNKAEGKYKSSDFIPASDLIKNDKSKVYSKDFKVSGENSTSKPQISESSDLDRLLKEMKAKVNTTLSTEKAKNAAAANNLENKVELSKEKTIKEKNNKPSNPLLLKFSIATIEKYERLPLEIPKININSSLVTSSIYFVPESDRIIHFNWSWLDKFIMN